MIGVQPLGKKYISWYITASPLSQSGLKRNTVFTKDTLPTSKKKKKVYKHNTYTFHLIRTELQTKGSPQSIPLVIKSFNQFILPAENVFIHHKQTVSCKIFLHLILLDTLLLKIEPI